MHQLSNISDDTNQSSSGTLTADIENKLNQDLPRVNAWLKEQSSC